MRGRVCAALRALHAVSVEAGGAPGIPDVNHARGWIELKQINAWPVRPEGVVRCEHFSQQQRIWIMERARAILRAPISMYMDVPITLVPPGLVHLLLRVGPGVAGDWLLLPGDYAAHAFGIAATKAQLLANSVKSWENGLDDAELLQVVRTTTR